MSGIINMPVNINITGLSDADKEQLSFIFESAARELYNQVVMTKGKAYADTLAITIAVVNSDSDED